MMSQENWVVYVSRRRAKIMTVSQLEDVYRGNKLPQILFSGSLAEAASFSRAISPVVKEKYGLLVRLQNRG